MALTTREVVSVVRRIEGLAPEYQKRVLLKCLGEYTGHGVRSRKEALDALSSSSGSLVALLGYFAFARAGGEQAGYNEICVGLLRPYSMRKDLDIWKDFPDWHALHNAFISGCEKSEILPNRKLNTGLIRDLYEHAQSRPEKGLLHTWGAEIRGKRSVAWLHRRLDNVHGIGRKIASFICRDTVYLHDLEARIPTDEFSLLQPVDTWIGRIAEFLNPKIDSDRDSEAGVAEFLAEVCSKAEVSGVAFNQGGWYLATNLAKSKEANLTKHLRAFAGKD
jgi:hypothetical protein